MTLHPRTDSVVTRPLQCIRCQVTGHEDPTVYARVTITGDHQPPLCSQCAHKLDRMARLVRRGDEQ